LLYGPRENDFLTDESNIFSTTSGEEQLLNVTKTYITFFNLFEFGFLLKVFLSGFNETVNSLNFV